MNIINIKGQKEFVEYFDKEQNIKILGTVSNSKSITQMFIPCKTKKLQLKIYDIFQKSNNSKKFKIVCRLKFLV